MVNGNAEAPHNDGLWKYRGKPIWLARQRPARAMKLPNNPKDSALVPICYSVTRGLATFSSGVAKPRTARSS